MRLFFRFFFLAVLFASVLAWAYFAYVSASMREAVLIEDRYTGIEREGLIYPGSARFIPNRIFPGRITLHRVRLFPRFLELHFKKGLEQSEMLGLDDSFYIRAVLGLNYRLNPQKLNSLFLKLSRPDWKELEPYLQLHLTSFLEQSLRKLYKKDKDLPGLKGRLQLYWRTLALKEFNQKFLDEGIEFLNLIVQKSYVPNPARYQAILASSQQIIKQKLERIRIVDLAQAHRDAERIKNQSYFERLKETAKLLQAYPHLQSYLAMDRLGKNVQVMLIPYEHWFASTASNSFWPLHSSSLQQRGKQKKQSNLQGGDVLAHPRSKPENSDPSSLNGTKGRARFSELSPP